MSVPPVLVNLGYACAVNPERCVRTVVSTVDNVKTVAQVLNNFNQEMYRRADQGDQVAHTYIYPDSPYIHPSSQQSGTSLHRDKDGNVHQILASSIPKFY